MLLTLKALLVKYGDWLLRSRFLTVKSCTVVCKMSLFSLAKIPLKLYQMVFSIIYTKRVGDLASISTYNLSIYSKSNKESKSLLQMWLTAAWGLASPISPSNILKLSQPNPSFHIIIFPECHPTVDTCKTIWKIITVFNTSFHNPYGWNNSITIFWENLDYGVNMWYH